MSEVLQINLNSNAKFIVEGSSLYGRWEEAKLQAGGIYY